MRPALRAGPAAGAATTPAVRDLCAACLGPCPLRRLAPATASNGLRCYDRDRRMPPPPVDRRGGSVRALEWLRGWAIRLLADDGAIAWMIVVAIAYGFATFVRSQATAPWGTDHMMSLASDLVAGHSDLSFSQLTTINDIVTIDGRHYQAMSLLPTVPYLPLVPFEFLWPLSRWIVSAVIGIAAGWLALPWRGATAPAARRRGGWPRWEPSGPCSSP